MYFDNKKDNKKKQYEYVYIIYAMDHYYYKYQLDMTKFNKLSYFIDIKYNLDYMVI